MARVARFGWALVLPALLAAGCGEEAGSSTYSVFLTCSPNSLLGDGSESSVCSVQVLDQDRVPAPAGTRIVLVGRSVADPSLTTGTFGTSRSTEEQAFLNDAGAVTTEFHCSDFVGSVAVVAQTEDGARGSAQVECEAIPGDWVIVDLVAERNGIRPGDDTEICAFVETGDGSVPPAVAIHFSVDTTNGGFGSTYASDRQDSTRDGRACVTFVAKAGDYRETVIVTASFENQSFGNSQVTTNIIVDVELPENEISCSAGDDSILADGVSQTTLTCTVFGLGASPAEGADVICEVIEGGGTLSNSGEAITDSNGTATITYTAGTEIGEAQIDCVSPGMVAWTMNITLISVGGVTARVPLDKSRLGIRGTNQDESMEVCFLVTDTNDQPFGSPIEVTFSTAGSTSEETFVAPSTAETDEEGVACTTLNSGTTFGFAIVEACAQVGLARQCGLTENIPVVGVTPSRGGMSLTCDVRNMGALRPQHLEGTTITAPDTGSLCTTCRLSLADRNGNQVGFPRQITFVAESGRFNPTAQVINDGNGQASVTWCAEGNLPLDVNPFEDEPSWVEDETGLVRNPRDGLVTIMAYVNGEEEFVDSYANGAWDETQVPGQDPSLFPEPFWDQSEPFVDANDNNIFDVDEEKVNVSGPGHTDGFDDVNGQWDGDANSVIWVETRVLLTSEPYFDVFDPDSCSPPDDWAHCLDFSGVAAGAPDDLDFDFDYPVDPRLSHWYIEGTDTTIYGNKYGPAAVSPSCIEESEHCFLTPAAWSGENPLNVYFVARDYNGNPVNGSLAGITHRFDRASCSNAITVERGDYTNPGNEFPFDFAVVRGGTLRSYEVRISDFQAGSVQRFILSPGAEAIPGGGCRMEMVVPLTACTGCGDPADTAPWPFFMINAPTPP